MNLCHPAVLILSLVFCGCVKNADQRFAEHMPKTPYADKFIPSKQSYPFDRWASDRPQLPQYTLLACAAFTAIFDQLIIELATMGEAASEAAKLQAFEKAVHETNRLYEADFSLIETGEREELCELFNQIARAAGLNPADYADGEGPASLWRDW